MELELKDRVKYLGVILDIRLTHKFRLELITWRLSAGPHGFDKPCGLCGHAQRLWRFRGGCNQKWYTSCMTR